VGLAPDQQIPSWERAGDDSVDESRGAEANQSVLSGP
jgi:hypothetical protein